MKKHSARRRPAGPRAPSRAKPPLAHPITHNVSVLPPEIENHAPLIFTICKQLVPSFRKAKSLHDVNDLYALAAHGLWQKREAIAQGFDPARAKMSTYVANIAQRILLNELQREKAQKRQIFRDPGTPEDLSPHFTSTPRHGNVSPLMREIYHRAKSQLSHAEQVFLDHLEETGNRYQSYLISQRIDPKDITTPAAAERTKKRAQAYYNRLVLHLQSAVKTH